jgi:hypothetical protein
MRTLIQQFLQRKRVVAAKFRGQVAVMKGMDMRRIDDTEAVLDEDGTVLRGRIKVPLVMMDSAQRAVAVDGLALSLHRPGYRTLDAETEDRRQRAYDKFVDDLGSAWKTPARVEQDREALAMAALDEHLADGGAQQIRDRSYLSFCDNLQNAWKAKQP